MQNLTPNPSPIERGVFDEIKTPLSMGEGSGRPTLRVRFLSLKNTCRFLVLWIVLFTNTSFLLSPFSFLLNKHAFHTSITEMRYNPKQKTFEISLRVFTDDLEKTLSANNQNKKFVIENTDKNDPFIEQYVRKHFAITTPKNQKLNYQFVGKEKEGDATWIYLEMPVNEAIKGSKIQNDVLIDVFDDQTNIVNIFVNNDKKSYLFTVKNKIFKVEI
jgi:hypothetical protein